MTLPARYEAMRAAASDPSLPRGDWHYDDGITDTVDGVVERGKHSVVETIHDGRHTLICDPYDFDDWARMDATGKHIAAANPAAVLRLLADLEEAVGLLRESAADSPWPGAEAFLARLDNDKDKEKSDE